jgi:hypothetical protein
MTDAELERKIRKNFPIRNRRLAEALRDGARRTNVPVKISGDKCGMCTRQEHGGGLSVYKRRDGSELLAGELCTKYLEYLIHHPQTSAALLRQRI